MLVGVQKQPMINVNLIAERLQEKAEKVGYCSEFYSCVGDLARGQ